MNSIKNDIFLLEDIVKKNFSSKYKDSVLGATFYFLIMFFLNIPVISLFIMIVDFGLILSIVCVNYMDIQHLWTVISMILMYASAFFYPMDIILEHFRKYMLLNPLYWFIDYLSKDCSNGGFV